MKHKPISLIADVCVAIVTSCIAVIAILPFSAIAFVLCFVTAFSFAQARIRRGILRLAAVGAITSMALSAVVIAAAANYRPAKVIEQQLSRTLELPATQLTLAELSYLANYDRSVYPIRLSMIFADADKNTVIEFSRRDVTLGQFLLTIEGQTSLQRRFMHCGNGYTVLGGGDCSFGLSVRPEERIDVNFDVDAYAADRDSV